MSRKPKAMEERRQTVTFSLMPADLVAYDALLERIKSVARSNGAQESDLDKSFSRSGFLREIVRSFSQPAMSDFIVNSILAGLGVLYHQEELDLGDKKKGQA